MTIPYHKKKHGIFYPSIMLWSPKKSSTCQLACTLFLHVQRFQWFCSFWREYGYLNIYIYTIFQPYKSKHWLYIYIYILWHQNVQEYLPAQLRCTLDIWNTGMTTGISLVAVWTLKGWCCFDTSYTIIHYPFPRTPKGRTIHVQVTFMI